MVEKSIESRLTKMETDFHIFQKIHETRIDYIEKTVMRHMQDEEKNIAEIKQFLKDLDHKIQFGEQLIDNRIKSCRQEVHDAHDEKFATKEELATIAGEVKSNAKLIAAWMAFIGVAIALVNLFT